MAMYIRNITFYILNIFLSLSSIGWFLLSLFPIGRYLHFSFRIRIAKNTPTSRFTIRIMKVLRQSPMRIHDVAGNFAIYYPHHEDALFMAKRLHEGINRALPTS
jgi:hypothetical protein